MPKLYFRYGTMNSSKTANLLMVAHNYTSTDRKVILAKPSCDVRFDPHEITSRAFTTSSRADILITPDMDVIDLDVVPGAVCMLVDEAQFLSRVNVDALREVSRTIPVICYGLRTDYLTRLFTGSKRLMEVADNIEEIKTVCSLCEKKAVVNAKYYIDYTTGKCEIMSDGPSELDLGGEDKYKAMCWDCYQIEIEKES